MNIQIDTKIYRKIDRQMEGQIDTKIYREMDRWIQRLKTNGQTDRKTD